LLCFLHDRSHFGLFVVTAYQRQEVSSFQILRVAGIQVVEFTGTLVVRHSR